MSAKPIILWLRQDLRLIDNLALLYASKLKQPIILIYILDSHKNFILGEASKWWLHNSLKNLDKELTGKLNYFNGDSEVIIDKLIKETGATQVVWNKCYEPSLIARDEKILRNLKEKDIIVETFNSNLLLDPSETVKKDKTPYKVFSAFYKKNYLSGDKKIRLACGKPLNLALMKIDSLSLKELSLMPKIKWYKNFEAVWQPGEKGANKRLKEFIDFKINKYKDGRNSPGMDATSRLSPHLHFGEISPKVVWHKLKDYSNHNNYNQNAEKFLSELGWREFNYSLLYFFPQILKKNLREKFDELPWENNKTFLKAWQKGETGYPIVDAGMRQLWQTGFMHNRVRMIVASFLTKHLLIDWRTGADWFYDCLVDADLANNSANWQWVAGTGMDAAPYFRIFNPTVQGKKFDSKGIYVKEFVPELKNLPLKYLFTPWSAPPEIRKNINYPRPIVEHSEARDKALMTYKNL